MPGRGQGQIGLGNFFQRESDDSSDGFATLAGFTEISPPQYTRETQDITDTGDTNGYRRFISGMRDAGEVSLSLNYVPGGDTEDQLLADLESDTAHNYRLLFANGVTCDFSAFVTAVQPTGPMESKMTASVSVKITGKPTWGSES
jgi:predicted secreted protein